MKNGGKNKTVAVFILFSVCTVGNVCACVWVTACQCTLCVMLIVLKQQILNCMCPRQISFGTTKSSQVTYVTMVPQWSPRGRYGERRQRDPCLKHTYIKTPPVGRRQPMMSLPARPQYKGRRENTSSTSSSECLRPKHGTQPRGRSVSFPTRGTMVTYVT